MANAQYAQPGSPGPFASTIGWTNFTGTSDITTTVQTVTNTLAGGYQVTFNISSNYPPPSTFPVTAVVPPVGAAGFGNTGYLGLTDPVVLTGTNNTGIENSIAIEISDIVVTDPNGIPVKDFIFVAADAGITGPNNKQIVFTTDGGTWSQIAALQSLLSTNFPNIIGIGGKAVTITSNGLDNVGDYIVSSVSPKGVEINLAAPPDQSLSVAFGIIIPAVTACSRDISASPKNSIIYVCPGRKQFYQFTALNCCGTVSLVYEGQNFFSSSNAIIANLGTYTILNSGILLDAGCTIEPGTTDILTFQVTDSCCDTPYNIDIVFTYSVCECCKCKRN